MGTLSQAKVREPACWSANTRGTVAVRSRKLPKKSTRLRVLALAKTRSSRGYRKARVVVVKRQKGALGSVSDAQWVRRDNALHPVYPAPRSKLRNQTTKYGAQDKGQRERDGNQRSNNLGFVGGPDLRKRDGCETVQAGAADALHGTANDTTSLSVAQTMRGSRRTVASYSQHIRMQVKRRQRRTKTQGGCADDRIYRSAWPARWKTLKALSEIRWPRRRGKRTKH